MPLPKVLSGSLELPIVGAPLFIVSGPELVIAQCNSGVVGSFPALNARMPGQLDEWLGRIETETGEYKARHPQRKVAPYAVNQICHATNDRLMTDMEVCVKRKVPIIITSLRPPPNSSKPRIRTGAWSSTTSSICVTRARPPNREWTD